MKNFALIKKVYSDSGYTLYFLFIPVYTTNKFSFLEKLFPKENTIKTNSGQIINP
jgi:hypothetical protein